MHSSGWYGRVLSVAILAALAGGVRPASAEDAAVVITGGADETHHLYKWTVTNHSNKRIVRIEFPQYGADLFETPDTWKQGTIKEMNLVNVGWDHTRPGLCWAEPVPPYTGLAPGASAQFGMRIAGMGAERRAGTVRVVFDDGSQGTIGGVELPHMPERGTPWLALIGAGMFFVIFIIYTYVFTWAFDRIFGLPASARPH